MSNLSTLVLTIIAITVTILKKDDVLIERRHFHSLFIQMWRTYKTQTKKIENDKKK